MPKTVKKGMLAALVVFIVATATVCGGKSDFKNKKVFKIGALQSAINDEYDSAYRGFVDGLRQSGLKEGEDFSIDHQNAKGEKSNCRAIAARFVIEKVDLVLAISTSAAKAVASETSKIPVLVTAVKDPANSKLVLSNKRSGTNIAGTSDLTPVKEQIQLIAEMLPKAEKVAVLYNAGQVDSMFQTNAAKTAASGLGLIIADAGVLQSSEIQSAVETIIKDADALYVTEDDMIASGMPAVYLIANEAKVPVIAATEGMMGKGGLATYGINYYELGKLTSAQAVDIIKNKANISDMPILYSNDYELVINRKVADDFGITIPKKLLNKARFMD